MPGLSRRRLLAAAAAAGGLALAAARAGAASPPAPRTLRLFRPQTGERFTDAYHDGTALLPEAQRRLDWLLRDAAASEATAMDPRLFDILWTLDGRYRRARGTAPTIAIHSGFRTAATNARLRTEGAALNSFHLRGQAVDISIQGYGIYILANLSRQVGQGGWGIYWRSHFVHLDTGPARFWYRR